MEKMRSASNILLGKLKKKKRKDQLGDRHRWEDNIKMGITE
jgi:hypothetical protein